MMTKEEFITKKKFEHKQITKHIGWVEDMIPESGNCSDYIASFTELMNKHGDVYVEFSTTGYDNLTIDGTLTRMETNEELQERINIEYDRYVDVTKKHEAKIAKELEEKNKEIAMLKARLSQLEG